MMNGVKMCCLFSASINTQVIASKADFIVNKDDPNLF